MKNRVGSLSVVGILASLVLGSVSAVFGSIPPDIGDYNSCEMTECIPYTIEDLGCMADPRCYRDYKFGKYEIKNVPSCLMFEPIYLPTGIEFAMPESVYGGHMHNGWAADHRMYGSWSTDVVGGETINGSTTNPAELVVKAFGLVPIEGTWKRDEDEGVPAWRQKWRCPQILSEARMRWPNVFGGAPMPIKMDEVPEGSWWYSSNKGHLIMIPDDISTEGFEKPNSGMTYPWKYLPRRAEELGFSRVDDRFYFTSWLYFYRVIRTELQEFNIFGGEHKVSLSPFAKLCVSTDDQTYSLLAQEGAFEKLYLGVDEYLVKYSLDYWENSSGFAEKALKTAGCPEIIPYKNRPMYWIYEPWEGCAIPLPLVLISKPSFGLEPWDSWKSGDGADPSSSEPTVVETESGDTIEDDDPTRPDDAPKSEEGGEKVDTETKKYKDSDGKGGKLEIGK